jgi:GDPmannose 4,6-dehydratase
MGVRLHLHYGDLADSVQMVKLLYALAPDEIYNLGAQSHVRVSFDIPEYTGDVVGLGTVRILEAIREAGLVKKCRFYQASSSEMFGKVQEVPQTERRPSGPARPTGAPRSSLLAHGELPRVLRAARQQRHPLQPRVAAPGRNLRHPQDHPCGHAHQNGPPGQALYLGNLDAQRDWGYAKEYVEMMWLMLQQEHPDDYVVATNETHSVREFCQEAFSHCWASIGKSTSGMTRYERPAEVEFLIGNPEKARRQLGWEPKVRFKELVRIMVDADLELARQEKTVRDATTA